VRLEPAVELDRVDVRNPVGEEAGEDAEARPDLEHDVLLPEIRKSSDHGKDVAVDEEVLP
jgi:hypothetical protein